MIYITEDDVNDLISMAEVIESVHSAFLEYSKGKAAYSMRDRLFLGGKVLNTMPAILLDEGLAGLKTYIAGKDGAHFVVLLFDIRSYSIKAVIEANKLGQLRTGAVTALASKLMTGKKNVSFGLIGTGFQAETQLLAMNELFKLETVKVFSRTPENSKKFADKFKDVLDTEIIPVYDVRSCVEDADVITTITTSSNPLFREEFLPDEFHLNLAGGNLPNRKEVGIDTLIRADLVVAESSEQSLRESGEIIEYQRYGGGNIVDFSSVVAKPERYQKFKRTIFKSMGIGLEDVAVGSLILKKITQKNR